MMILPLCRPHLCPYSRSYTYAICLGMIRTHVHRCGIVSAVKSIKAQGLEIMAFKIIQVKRL